MTPPNVTRCVVSVVLRGAGRRGRNGQCPSRADAIAPVVYMIGAPTRQMPVCRRHAAVHDRGTSLYTAEVLA